MTETTISKIRSLLAAEFDRQGWEFDLSIGQQLVGGIETSGGVDSQQLAQSVPAEFLHRNRTNRERVAAVIERSVGGLTPTRAAVTATLAFTDNRRYEIKVSGGAQIANSNLNVGDGTQINVDLHVHKQSVLAAVEAILRAGLDGDWNRDAARELASVIDGRSDIDLEDVRHVAIELVSAEQPKQRRVKELLSNIAASGLGGALGTGISTAMGELVKFLPS